MVRLSRAPQIYINGHDVREWGIDGVVEGVGGQQRRCSHCHVVFQFQVLCCRKQGPWPTNHFSRLHMNYDGQDDDIESNSPQVPVETSDGVANVVFRWSMY